jgi:HAD superfamily hydrolase (TIGR01509 family)
MTQLPAFSAVIFDMDGLVLDTESSYALTWQQAALSMDFVLSDSFCSSLSGLSGADVKDKLLVECGADFDLARFNQVAGSVWRDYVSQYGLQIKHGFHDLLAFVIGQRLPYCLATNSRLANALECLELADLNGVFKTLISRDDVTQGKPAPDIFLQAAQRLNIPIQHCLVLEDSHAGVVAATTAGAPTIYVPSTSPINPITSELCTMMLTDLEQVQELLRTHV